MKFSYVVLCLSFLMLTSGCASMKDFWAKLNGVNKPENVVNNQDPDQRTVRYSENPQMNVPSDRQYRRMTRARMEEESDLGSNAGSTWVMEGQGAYLFAQNKTRREGDTLNIKLDGPNQKQVETKVSVIKKLLKQLDEQKQNEVGTGPLAEGAASGDRTPASADKAAEPAKDAAAAPPADGKGEDKDKEELAAIQQITTKIVERMPDGNYRVKGAQPFMIGKREYKVIVAGMVKPEDFNDEGISSGKLIDPQFDVVSIRRNPHNE